MDAIKPKVIVITGPTASGKTDFSVELSRRLGGEIVSADSMLVYRGMDVGTAKPTTEERQGVAHHLIDVVEPSEPYHAGRFRADATAALNGIAERGRVCFVVGGTALYIKVLLEGLAEGPGRDEVVRGGLEARWDAGERSALFAELGSVDPETAARLHPNDRTRIVRALEIWHATGQKASGARLAHGFAERPYDSLILGMQIERQELYRRIDARVDAMIERGFVDEVRRLLEDGVSREASPMKAIGYAEMAAHLLDGVPLEETIALVKKSTRHFARRQLTWMRKFDAHWVGPDEIDQGERLAEEFLSR